jgi:alpha-galactosidase
VASTATRSVEERKLTFRIAAVVDRREVLEKADFVVISLEVGDRFAPRDTDWKLPLQFGIRQAYGENGGPGGFFHALRITPYILAVCGDVERLCPDATVFCCSNPMTAIATSVHRKLPQLKFVGRCHEIASLARYLPAMLDTPFENLRLCAGGLNHFSVLLEASYADPTRDASPDILAKAPAFFAKEVGCSDVFEYVQRSGKAPDTQGSTGRFSIGRERSLRPWTDRTLFRFLLERFGLLPITADSHLGEHIHWAHDVAHHRGIHDFCDFYRMSLIYAKTEIRLERHERAVAIMEGTIGDTRHEEAAVDIPSAGPIPDLPGFVAVEVPAVVGRGGLECAIDSPATRKPSAPCSGTPAGCTTLPPRRSSPGNGNAWCRRCS